MKKLLSVGLILVLLAITCCSLIGCDNVGVIQPGTKEEPSAPLGDDQTNTNNDTDTSPSEVDKNTSSEGEKDNNAAESYSALVKYSLGTGINVITGTYLDFDGATFKVNEFLDRKTLALYFDTVDLNAQSTQLQTIEENDISVFTKKFSNQFTHADNVNLGFGVDGFGFSSTLSNKFSISNNFEIAETTKQFYYLSYQNIVDSRKAIANFDETKIKNGKFITDYALAKLDAMSVLSDAQLKSSIISFFNTFGTHIITDAKYGGKLEIYYYNINNEANRDEDLGFALSNAISAAINIGNNNIGASTSNNLDTKLRIGSSTSTTIANFSANGIGGKGFTASNFSAFADAYKTWIDNYNSQSEHSTMIDISSGGLYPIWDLLPTKYTKLANKMKDVFNENLQDVNDLFLSKFTTTATDCGNTVEFAGGKGSAEAPFLISTVAQLLNVEKYMEANCYFKLISDIDVGSETEWEPIGGMYLQKKFNGCFDGDNHKIINLTRKEGVPEKDNRSYFGLFGAINEDGVVKNIIFENTNIQIKGVANNNGNMRAFFGIVAGQCKGTVSYIELKGTFTYSCCTNGESWLGGVCGYAVNATISNCKNYINITADRYSSCVGGIVGYSQGGIIQYCANYGDLTAKGTSWGGIAYVSGIGVACHKTNPTTLLRNANYGDVTAKAYDNTGALLGFSCTRKTGTTDFVIKYNTTY